MTAERALTAAELFDAIGSDYERVFGRPPMVRRAVEWLTRTLPPGARVLDIGSGTGRPVADELVRAGHEVVGLDVSARMVELATAQVPGARFVHADIRSWESPHASWNAVCAFFPFLQMSRAETESILARIARWLVPGGLLALTTVPLDAERVPVRFFDHLVEVTSFATADLLRLLEQAGLNVLESTSETFAPDPERQQPEEHLLVLASRPE